jgi:2-polyprenyl-3-methyl-5-hydroxy-6-metoxy-1,4-benzoquinol methylase
VTSILWGSFLVYTGKDIMKRDICKNAVCLNGKYTYFYDLELKDFLQDLKFYKEHMPEDAKNILELGCGTGRLGLALARAGYSVTGIDISHSMLQAAVRKCEVSGDQIRIHFIRMDMTQMAFRTYFDAILLPYNTLNMLIDVRTLAQCLNFCQQYLKKDGRLMMDIFTPNQRYISLNEKRLLQFESLQCPDGSIIQKEVSRGYNPKTSLLDMNETYRVYQGCTKRPQETYRYDYQLIGLSGKHWEDILTHCGFILEVTYGDYALNPYIPLKSTKMLVVAKPEEA